MLLLVGPWPADQGLFCMKNAVRNAAYDWTSDVDYRANRDLYRVGKGERGVLICEPYKSELLPIGASARR